MEFVTMEKQGRIMLIGLNRPKERNRLDLPMILELSEAYTRAEDDPEVLCSIVFAHGKHFTLGMQLDKMRPVILRDRAWPYPEGNVDPWGVTGRARSKPVICAVHGMCFTAGIEMMLAADINLAAERTMFAQAEVMFGIMPFGGGTMRWVQAVGWGNAMRYLLTADNLDAGEAHRIGLVQEVVPKERLMERALEIASRICDMAPLGISATIESARLSVDEGIETAAKAILPAAIELAESEDSLEGVTALVEKRKANFIGK